MALTLDTRNINLPWRGKIYVVAANDWPAPSGEVMIYDIPTDKWRHDLPELPTPRADLAGTFVPLCTSDTNDGLPGLWTFGGRVNESCDPPLGPVEYYPLPCEGGCIGFTSVGISGPVLLAVNETGFYSATTYPADASNPVSLLWNNGAITPETTYNWDIPGTYTVEITSTNCEGSAVVTDTQVVDVYVPCSGLTGAVIDGPTSLMVGEIGLYTVTLTPTDATLPIDVLWSNDITDTQAAYSWGVLGLQAVSVEATNCGGTVEAPPFNVEVIPYRLWLPILVRIEAR